MNTKDFILKKAFQLFLEKGFSEVSVNDIIGAAGVTKGGFYHYFKSKDMLIEEVIYKYICPFFMAPVESMKTELLKEKDLESKFRFYFFNVHRICVPDSLKEVIGDVDLRQFYFLVYEGMKRYRCLSEARKEIYNEKIRLFQDILEEGKEKGFLAADLDTHEWAVIINSIKDGIISLNLLDETIDIDEKCRISFEQILNEIRA